MSTNKSPQTTSLFKRLDILFFIVFLTIYSPTYASDEAVAKPTTKNETESRARRASSFVRIGRPSSFVRIGKDAEYDDDEDTLEDTDEFEPDTLDKKASSFVRIGRGSPLHRFIRIGRLPNSESYTDEQFDNMFGDKLNTDKKSNHFVRIGKPFVRIGKGDSSYLNDDSDDGSIGNDLFNNYKRESSFVRIGKSPFQSDISYTSDLLKRAPAFVRIGKTPNFVRIGKTPNSFVRIGKSEYPDYGLYPDKRANSFVRIGKALDSTWDSLSAYDNQESIPFNMQDLKRASNFVRIGKSGPAQDKRAFVRIGKSGDEESQLEDDHSTNKRPFVRIGKSGPLTKRGSNSLSEEKRAQNFVRIGKLFSPNSGVSSQSYPSRSSEDRELQSDQPISVGIRAPAFVRIGKIPSSAFVRIGKNGERIIMRPDMSKVRKYSRGSRGSSFVRIGRK